jgi:hypothetical protein
MTDSEMEERMRKTIENAFDKELKLLVNVESGYEGNGDPSQLGGVGGMTEAFFRDQHYVFMLSGATGDIFPPPLFISIFESTITALKPWLLRVLKYNIFVHHPSIATDTSLRSASTWEFNGANFRLSSAAMSKV